MMIPPGIDQATWSSYQQSKASRKQAFETFGRIESKEGTGTTGTYMKSAPASASDLELLNHARANRRIAMVLIADEDGKPYARDWDDGAQENNVPRLVIRRGETDRNEAAQRAFENVCHAVINSADFLYID